MLFLKQLLTVSCTLWVPFVWIRPWSAIALALGDEPPLEFLWEEEVLAAAGWMAWCRLPCCVFRACIWLSGLSPGLKKSRAAPGWVSWCWGSQGRWISSWEEGQLVWRKVQLSCSLGTGLSRGDCTQGNSKAAAARVTDCSSKLLAKRAREMRASRGRRVKQPYCCWGTHLESHRKLGLLTSAPNIQCKCFSRGSLSSVYD